MFCVHWTTPSFTSASVPCRRIHNLSRGRVKCTTTTDQSARRAVKTATETWSSAVMDETLCEKTRFEGFNNMLELVYKESFMIRISEIGVNKTATIEAIASLLVETICNHCRRFGWSTDGFPASPAMKKQRLIWITANVHIEMYKYPVWGDVVEIEQWCEPDGRVATRFDSIIRNSSTGEVIGRSTRKCLMMNQDTRKLQKLNGDVKEEFLAICTKSPRLAFPDNDNPLLRKIPKLEEPADYSELDLMPRKADIDNNMHVNNVTYYSWLIQSIPQDIVQSHELEAITIEYRHECKFSDSIDSLSSSEFEVEPVNVFHNESSSSNSNMNSGGRRQFLHLLKYSGSNSEISLGRTVWRKINGS